MRSGNLSVKELFWYIAGATLLLVVGVGNVQSLLQALNVRGFALVILFLLRGILSSS